MRGEKFRCSNVTSAKQMADIVAMYYPPLIRGGGYSSYEEYREDIMQYPFADSPQVQRALEWCRTRAIAINPIEAKLYAKAEHNVSNQLGGIKQYHEYKKNIVIK